MSSVLPHISESDLADYIVDVRRLNSRPVHLSESRPGEYLIDTSKERVVHWWRLRRDLAVIPRFLTAANDAGLSYEEGVALLRAVADTNKYDFGNVNGIIEATAEIMEVTLRRGKPFKEALSAFRAFLVEARKDGEVDRAFGIVRLGVVAGMSIEQSLDIVQTIYDGPGIAGYVFMALYDELDALGANVAGGDLVYEAVKSAYANGISFSDLTSLVYAAVTQTTGSQAEIFQKLIGALTAPEAPSKMIAGQKPDICAVSVDPFQAAEKALLPQSNGGAVTTKASSEYFPEIGIEKLTHGVLPYRMTRSLADGLADLRGLMKSSGVEGVWVFDLDSETWFSLGGRTTLQTGRLRHEFAPYDVSALSDRPILVHIHPQNNEVFIAPNRDSLAFPQLQTKLVSFLTAMPSGSDFGMITQLARKSTRPVEITGLIVTSMGITEFHAPADVEDMEALVSSFKFAKGEVMTDFDAKGYLDEHGIAEPDFMFVERLLPAVQEKLPSGFGIAISTHEDFDPDMSFGNSNEVPPKHELARRPGR
jgi:hypothetical protein